MDWGRFSFTHKDNSMLIDNANSYDNEGFMFRWRTLTNLNILTAGAGGVGEITIFSKSIVSGGHFNHLCFIINQTGATNTKYVYLYINGTLEAYGSAQSDLTDYSQTQDFGNVSFLGRTSNPSLNTDGYADEIVIANGSFNSDYVKHLYELGLAHTRIDLPDIASPAARSLSKIVMAWIMVLISVVVLVVGYYIIRRKKR